jgi:hypothetical protein
MLCSRLVVISGFVKIVRNSLVEVMKNANFEFLFCVRNELVLKR